MAACDRFLVIGTHWGLVYVLDVSGNSIKSFASHTKQVTSVCIDSSMQYVGSAGLDGKVVVVELYGTETPVKVVRQWPIMCLALDPEYNSRKRFVEGGKDGKLTMNEPGWMTLKSRILHTGDGSVYTVKWQGNCIAWANKAGVHILHTVTQQRIGFIKRSEDSPPPDLFRCHLCWASDVKLLIGWADSVQVAVVKEKHPETISTLSRHATSYTVEIIAILRTDYWVSGLAPYTHDSLAVLGYAVGDDPTANQDVIQGPVLGDHLPPEMFLLDYDNNEIAAEQLAVLNYSQYTANDYSLFYHGDTGEKRYFVISPRDIIMALTRDLDDHVDWLMARKKYGEALQAVEEGLTKNVHTRHKAKDVGQQLLAQLFQQQAYDRAGVLCPKLLAQDGQLWKLWIFKFAQEGQLQAISPFIPTDKPQLDASVYEGVLAFFLHSNSQLFRDTVLRWPRSIYNVKSILSMLERRVAMGGGTGGSQDDDALLTTLADLYVDQDTPKAALRVYLQLRSEKAFSLVTDHGLYSAVTKEIVALIECGSEQALELLLDHVDEIPVSNVVDQLQDKPQLLLTYLNALFLRNTGLGWQYHECMVEMYAKYDPASLMYFLRHSVHYTLEKALSTCEAHGLVMETVFVLGRIGHTRQALTLIIERLGDVNQAIDFAIEHDDEELWADLLSRSLDKPDFIKGLLHHGGNHINPVQLLQRIPPGLDIEGLRDVLVKVLHDHNLQVSLRQGCAKILVSDCMVLLDRLVKAQQRGLPIPEYPACELCHESLAARATTMVTFFCKHTYHQDCLSSKNTTTRSSLPDKDSGSLARANDIFCPLCQNQERHLKSTSRMALQPS